MFVQGVAVVLCVLLLGSGNAMLLAQDAAPAQEAAPAEEDAPKLSNDQLDSLVAPIALYPDPLLAQTLVASTYPLEIIQLQQWLAKNPNLKDKALADAVAKQPWDPAIQSMAAVPDVVKRLADDIQWTTELGNAFLAQQSDVMDAVQRMRKKAKDKGALESNEQQEVETKVVEEKTVIVVRAVESRGRLRAVLQPDRRLRRRRSIRIRPSITRPTSPAPRWSRSASAWPWAPPSGAAPAAAAAGAGAGTTRSTSTTTTISTGTRTSAGTAAAGNSNWQHNSQHRGGAPYSNKATASKYGGSARGGSQSASNRQGSSRAGGAGASSRAGGRGRRRRLVASGRGERVERESRRRGRRRQSLLRRRRQLRGQPECSVGRLLSRRQLLRRGLGRGLEREPRQVQQLPRLVQHGRRRPGRRRRREAEVGR